MLAGGCALAALAGAVNAVFMIRLGTSVSHQTGDLSRLAIDVGAGQDLGGPVRFVLAALTGFVAGATLSGFTIHHPTLELSRPYGRAVGGIGLALIGAWVCLGRADAFAVGMSGAACGFQNALATHYRGVVLRTTHATGLLTDLGVSLGMRLRGHDVRAWKIGLPLMLVLGFSAGATSGAAVAVALGDDALLALGVLYLVGGIGWSLLKRSVLRMESGAGPTT